MLDVFGGRALVAPAFPAQGRTTLGGVQHVHGRAGAALRRAPRSGLAGGRRAHRRAGRPDRRRPGAGGPPGGRRPAGAGLVGSAGLAYAAPAWAWHRAPRRALATQRAQGPLAEAGPRRAAPARRSRGGRERARGDGAPAGRAGWRPGGPPRRLAPFPGGAEPEEVARWVGSSTALGGVVVSFGAGLHGAQRARCSPSPGHPPSSSSTSCALRAGVEPRYACSRPGPDPDRGGDGAGRLPGDGRGRRSRCWGRPSLGCPWASCGGPAGRCPWRPSPGLRRP